MKSKLAKSKITKISKGHNNASSLIHVEIGTFLATPNSTVSLAVVPLWTTKYSVVTGVLL